ATDDVHVAPVDFVVDGVVIASALTPPYAATFTPSRPAGSVLTVRAVAKDSSNNQAFADSQTRIVSTASVGSGGVFGVVYDDTTGLPAAGAGVALVGSDLAGHAYTGQTTTDTRGQYFLNAVTGTGTLQISRADTTRVDRVVDVPSDGAAAAFDARLTPLATS